MQETELTEGMSIPGWLLQLELFGHVPARAALLLRCHLVLARAVGGDEDFEERKDDDLVSPSGHTRGTHVACATALAEALLRYWQPPPSLAAGAGCGTGATRDAAQLTPPPPPLLCSDMTVLAYVVSAAQVCMLQRAPPVCACHLARLHTHIHTHTRTHTHMPAPSSS